MVSSEMSRRYVGTFMGSFWAFVSPLMTLAIFWFVFSVGLKLTVPSGTPYFFYFAGGALPWFLFLETVTIGTGVVVDNRHLIAKMAFPAEVLPVVNLLVAVAPHAAITAVFVVALELQGLLVHGLGVLWVFYYFLGTAILSSGLVWALSALRVFIHDITQIIAVLLNMVFWLTPIVWTPNIIPDNYRWIIDWNPIAYLADGYRDALMSGASPLADPIAAFRFWLIAIFFLAGGARVFARLRPEFADLL